MTRLQQAQALAEQGQIEDAWDIIKDDMSLEPNNPHLLIAATYCMQKAANWPVAYHLAKASAKALPNRPEPLLNISAACDQLYQTEEGIEAARKAYKLADSDNLRGAALMNESSILINNGRYKEAMPVLERALKYRPGHKKTLGNLGMAQLANGDWEHGWDNYAHSLGTAERMRIDYGLPDWNGEDGTVVIHGEQGLGDEISFASVLPDVEAEAIIDCDYRLKGLFQRSFPRFQVNGGRWKQKYSGEADYQCAIGDLGRLYRRKAEDFPRKPYLVADPIRRSQWQALRAQVNKPLIGIAWTGGMPHTASKYRQLDKVALSAIVQGIDAHFVSLEYKEREPVDGIHVYPWATLTDDYDDTAALVAECDLVICVQTAVAHLDGALGVPCMVLVPSTSQWRYAPDEMLWYGDNFYVYKQPWDFKEIIEDAKRHLG